MRKYLFSGALLGAILSIFGPIRVTTSGARRGRVLLVWLAWLATVAAAVIAVQEDSRDRDGLYEDEL